VDNLRSSDKQELEEAAKILEEDERQLVYDEYEGNMTESDYKRKLYFEKLPGNSSDAFRANTTEVTTSVGGGGWCISNCDGKGAAVKFNMPYAIRMSLNGKFALMTDRSPVGSKLRRIDLENYDAENDEFTVKTVAGGSADGYLDDAMGTNALFSDAGGIAISADSSFALVADTSNHMIRMVELDDDGDYPVTTIAGVPNSCSTSECCAKSSVSGCNQQPASVGIQGNGNDDGYNETYALRYGYPRGFIDSPSGIALSVDGCFAVFTEQSSARIRTLTTKDGCAAPFHVLGEIRGLAGKYLMPGSDNGIGTDARFRQPEHVAIYPNDKYAIVSDVENNKLRKVFLGDDHAGGYVHGEVIDLVGSVVGYKDGAGSSSRFFKPTGFDISPTYDFLLVADSSNHVIRRVDLADNWVATVGGEKQDPDFVNGNGVDSRFNRPADVIISYDSSYALVLGQVNRVIRKMDLKKPIVTDAPTPYPTACPTSAPSPIPTGAPTAAPTTSPTASPTAAPTYSPTFEPTLKPLAEDKTATYIISGLSCGLACFLYCMYRSMQNVTNSKSLIAPTTAHH
jgi:hypothetical protein